MSSCQFVKIDNTQCKAKAVGGDVYCFWHSEKMRPKRDLAVLDGGLSPKRCYGRDMEVKINNTWDVLHLVEDTINDLRTNNASTRIANAIGYLAGIALKAIEQGDLEKRLEVIEGAIGIKRQIR